MQKSKRKPHKGCESSCESQLPRKHWESEHQWNESMRKLRESWKKTDALAKEGARK